MASVQPLQIMNKSRTLRVTWLLILVLVLFPILTLWLIPWLRWKVPEFAPFTEPGTAEWIIAFAVGSIGCVVLIIGMILAFQNRKVAFPSRILTALGVLCTLLLWGYWFHATTAKTASATPAMPAHSVKLTWRASSSPVTGYNIYRSTSPNNFAEPKLNSAPIPDTSFVDTTVESHKTYYYSTKAVDSRGSESSDSNIVRVDVP